MFRGVMSVKGVVLSSSEFHSVGEGVKIKSMIWIPHFSD